MYLSSRRYKRISFGFKDEKGTDIFGFTESDFTKSLGRVAHAPTMAELRDLLVAAGTKDGPSEKVFAPEEAGLVIALTIFQEALPGEKGIKLRILEMKPAGFDRIQEGANQMSGNKSNSLPEVRLVFT
jgi:hypothetical protein